MQTFITAITLWFLLCAVPAAKSAAQPAATIAVAANFLGALSDIVAAYESESGAKLQTVSSSTGKLYAQISNGAPYDLFLAADARRPELLAEAGLCAEPFVYASGNAVLWSGDPGLAGESDWRQAIISTGTLKIALASPETAPYGAVARMALDRAGLLPRVSERLVYGQNVAQAFQFAVAGGAALAFTALSLTRSERGRQGTVWPIPEAPAVVQKGCLVTASPNQAEIHRFLDFFRQPASQAILNKFGYR